MEESVFRFGLSEVGMLSEGHKFKYSHLKKIRGYTSVNENMTWSHDLTRGPGARN